MKRIETTEDSKRVQIKAGEYAVGQSILVEKDAEELGGQFLVFKIEKLGEIFDGVDKDGHTLGTIPVQYAYGDLDVTETAAKISPFVPDGFDDVEALALAVQSAWMRMSIDQAREIATAVLA